MFLSARRKKEVVLIYDIGNLSVGGTLAVISSPQNLEEKPRIIYAARKSAVLPEKPDPKKLLATVAKSLEEVSRDLEKNGLNHLKFTKLGTRLPERAFCVLSSPWYASQTRTVTLKKDKPFTVTKKMIGELLSDETAAFKKSLSTEAAFGGNESVLVESDIVKIKLNGYETALPEGKQAAALSVSAFLSVSPEEVPETFAGKIKKVFNLEKISFNSFPLTAFSALKSAFGKQNFIFADVSGETTDVLLSKDGTLSEIVTFPLGKQNAVREISNKMKTTPAEALSLFYLYQEKKLSGEEEQRVAGTLVEVGESWLRYFREALVELGNGFSLPSAVFFTADKDSENWFGSLIKKEDYSQFALTEAPFSIRPVNAESLSGACIPEGTVKRDQFLMIEAIFAAQSFAAQK